MNTENNSFVINVLLAIIIFSVILNILFVFRISRLQQKAIAEPSQEIMTETKSVNQNVISFLKLFVKDVLKTDKKIDAQAKTELENTIKSMQDKEIANSWQIFVNSKTESEAQKNVKNFLEILVNKLE